MLQRLAQFRVALLEFLEKSHVLDGDHCLVGKGFEKGYLFIREGTDFFSANMNNPDRNCLRATMVWLDGATLGRLQFLGS